MSPFKRILLAEDDPQDAELTLKALSESRLSNDVLRVQDGAEALDYLKQTGAYADRAPGHPTLVMLDLKMPKVTGLQVLEAMRSDENLKMIPVVVLTSSRESPDLEKAYRLGVNAYVVKPVIFEEFISTVKQLGMFWAVTNEPPPGSGRSFR